MRARVVDFETTGMPSEDDPHAVVEIGWCDVIDGVVGEPQAMLVNPRRPIPPLASAVHHIVDADVAEAPSIDIGILKLIQGHPDFWVAHNSEFEQQFFKGTVPWICTYRVAIRLWPEADEHNNSALRYLLDLPCDRDLATPPHRAGPDAYVTAHLFARILQERPDGMADMLRWSRGPALWHRMKFGKHGPKQNGGKGMLMSEVPSSYLEWMLDQKDMDKEARANALYQLKIRADPATIGGVTT